MATLTRPKASQIPASDSLLASTVPSPFPVAERERYLREEQEELAAKAFVKEQDTPSENQQQGESSSKVQHELLPSIALVQKSCLMTLNNLLSVPVKWIPIVPDRRHSVPSDAQSISSTDAVQSSALYTLVSNLRNREELMIESHPVHSDTELISELRTRVEALSSTLDPNDARLARTLISLLAHLDRFSVIQASSSTRDNVNRTSSFNSLEPTAGPSDLFDTLKRQLSDLQNERLSHADNSDNDAPVLAVEKDLLWSQIDEELESVVLMCKERTDGLPRFSSEDQLPPEYDPADYEIDPLPAYHFGKRISCDGHDSKTRPAPSSSMATGLNEKMRLDLESVTMAIDRLYLVAPQLHDQRVELKSSKLEQMEKARRVGMQSSAHKQAVVDGKRKGREVDELDGILDLLSKATDRKLSDQSVLLDGGMKTRLEESRKRDMQKREAFVEQLLHHSTAGRLHAQDAVLSPVPRTKDPETLLTLPEFLRQAVPDSIRLADPNALLTLPEFFKEPVPERILQSSAVTRLKSKKSRHRSLSAPPMSWLRPSISRSPSIIADQKPLRPSSSLGTEQTPKVGFDVHYIAENHENLHHVLVFLTITGAMSGVDVEAEVLPSFPNVNEGDRLLIRNGPNTSAPLLLPARTFPGKKEVKSQGEHYEIKLSTSPFTSHPEPLPLLDASQLTSLNPMNFTCSSCSLPLVHASFIKTYRDLPSEHWEELVDAWMCHGDQHLHEQIVKRGSGFWPEPGQALVGGSYILFEASSMVPNNLCQADETKRGEDWRCVRCICGAVVGRSQEHRSGKDMDATVYRLVKYAIRPMSATSEPLKIPLSAFIVEDMNEFVQAHATYRFVIFDEEEERPRILIWLFKPNIKIAYSVPVQHAIPKSGSLHAAKVLYKIVGPWAAPEQLKGILSKYPGFPQAEYLYYPINTCRRVAALLRESNTAYPESMRTMTGLDVGWLHRA